jgi:Aminoglycoside adenylyltransferase, C-terminal domain
MDIPEPIRAFCSTFLAGLTGVLRHKLFAVYLYGAWAFPEGKAKGDVDLYVILRESLSEVERSGIENLHRAVALGFPSLVGESPDAWYILVEDACGMSPPKHQLAEGLLDESWALHRAHMRAGRCIILFGPDPRELLSEPHWRELDVALQSELHYVAAHLADYPAYCILNLCRLMYSYQTGDVVVSKVASALWAAEMFPDRGPCIEAALHAYDRAASEGEQCLVASEASPFFEFAHARISTIRHGPQAP